MPIVDEVLRQHQAGTYRPGVKAIIVYPMNALANSQYRELERFLKRGYAEGGEPVTFRRYTGQDKEAERKEILANPPDILLTNYVMLELVLTRPDAFGWSQPQVGCVSWYWTNCTPTAAGRAPMSPCWYDACGSTQLQCVGTSATMTTSALEQGRLEVAKVAGQMFGVPVSARSEVGRR